MTDPALQALLNNPAALQALQERAADKLAERQLELYRPYDKQRVFHAYGATIRERLLMAGNQLGKASYINELVLTPTGWTRIGEVKVGDHVIAGDGTPTEVIGVFPQGVRKLVEVTFDYGQTVVCDYDHLWTVLPPKHRWKTTCRSLPREGAGKKRETEQVPNPKFGVWEVWKTADIIAKHGMTPKPLQRFATPYCGAVQFAPQDVPVDPYVIGLLLGDGCFQEHCLLLTTSDVSLAAVFKQEVEKDGGSVNYDGAYGYRAHHCKGLKADLRGLGLQRPSHEKRVPAVYLWNTPDVRLAVLQGLMDTDGTCEKSGVTTFTSTSAGLADNVLFLIRSFGGKGHIRSRITNYTHNGEKREGRESYTVTIRLPHVPLFRLERKLARYVRPKSTSDYNIIESFREVEPAEAVCIAVAHPDRTYVTRGFIVTHNSYCGAAEAAYHLTGLYPDWWQGRRFDKPVTMWAAGVTSEATRDVPQRLLMGRVGAIGTGLIPKKSIVEHSSTRGIADALDTVVIKHKTGRNSRLAFKSYEKGREKWQGETLDVVWLDEEPPSDIYTEALTRTNATGGMVYMTFTPLLGMSDVVRMFYPQPNTADRVVVKMTIEDAEHISAEDRQRIINSYPAHEREARVAGVPMLGSGRVFPVPESAIICEPFTLPGHWPRIAGLDLGWDHPTAAAKLAWDRDNDVVYVTHSYRVREATILQHAAALKAWGNQLPFAWPHDALSHDRGSGETMAELYRRQGLNMLFERAMFEDGGAGVEAGIAMMLDRLETGRLKIFAHLEDWRSEYRLYHRKDGKVVKENDDLMSATRYALMCLRFATLPKGAQSGPLKRKIGGLA